LGEQLCGEEYSHFFKVDLDFFQGPVDLLLHLVKQNELPIEKVSLAEVATQYLECIEALHLVDLDIAGEYLVIAATLLSIKSSVLLNEPVELVQDEEGNLINPHDELLRRLREAEIYRDGAAFLGKKSCLGLEVFAAPSTLGKSASMNAPLKEHDPMLLGRAFRKLLERTAKDNYRVEFVKVSVVDQMVFVLDTLRGAGGIISFQKLMEGFDNRIVLLASFIALLELCKKQAIVVSQEDSFSDITITLIDEGAEIKDFASEFDTQEALATVNA
jgi:segregation and condensation protein A